MTVDQAKAQQLVDLVRKCFPGWESCSDPRFIKEEISYKRTAVDKAAQLLNENELRELVREGRYDEFIARLDRLGKTPHFLYVAVPRSGDLGILYQETLDKPSFCAAALNLLYGSGPSHERLETFSNYVRSSGLPNKWPFPTLFLFLSHPASEMFVVPKRMQWFLRFMGMREAWTANPSASAYRAITNLCQALRDALAEYGAQDMVDVQSVIYVAHRAATGSSSPVESDEFARLFEEFCKSYAATPEGQKHAAGYPRMREEARRNYEAILKAAEAGQDVTDEVLLKLLPYADSPGNRATGAWMPVAPSITGDLRAWFEAKRWTKPEDWPAVAQSVLAFVRKCVGDPRQLSAACAEFSALPYSKGFQTGMLTPILNALRPDDFVVVNNKSRPVINHFAHTAHGQKLTDYPAANDTARRLIESFADMMRCPDLPDARPGDLFDMFCHWLVAVKLYDLAPIDEGVNPECPFSDKTFELLAALDENPTYEFYNANKEALRQHVMEPFQQLMMHVAELLPPPILQRMETQKRVFSSILKQFAHQGCWPWYWGAFYPKGGRRIEDAQLYLSINRDQLTYGFYIGEYGSEQRSRFVRNVKSNQAQIARIVEANLRADLRFGPAPEEQEATAASPNHTEGPSLMDWLQDPSEWGIRVSRALRREDVLRRSATDLAQDIADVYQRLFPLVLLATDDDPMPAIGQYTGEGESPEPPKPVITLARCAQETHLEEDQLQRWVRAIERKGQAIIYGPPGTGKTYVAEWLAKHLIGGGDGFCEVVQFHPAYAYEDFVQGIRPRERADGGLSYPVVRGRFLDFCLRARGCQGRCVLIIDEINRANLARVFGELMYLLEYRDREIPLAAGGTFGIPGNVRIIGTMNTADRSIALVDHALRRRFAFLALYPNYDILRRYHERTGFPVKGLINVLRKLNQQIGDRHYEVGITFFLRDDLQDQLEDVWRMEIEPYLEEYFFDQPGKVDQFRWDAIKKELV